MYMYRILWVYTTRTCISEQRQKHPCAVNDIQMLNTYTSSPYTPLLLPSIDCQTPVSKTPQGRALDLKQSLQTQCLVRTVEQAQIPQGLG